MQFLLHVSVPFSQWHVPQFTVNLCGLTIPRGILLCVCLSVGVESCVVLNVRTLAYVTYPDIRHLRSFVDQTVIAIKAPPETRLELPDPKKVSLQPLIGWLVAVLIDTCDIISQCCELPVTDD